MDGAHLLPMRVYWEDTDAGGIVYHASYIRWMERGRTEYLRALGLDQRMMQAAGMRFIVKSMKIEFRRPALFDDSLLIRTQCTKIGGASLRLDQRVMRGAEGVADAEVLCVAIDDDDKPMRLPDELRRRLDMGPSRNTV